MRCYGYTGRLHWRPIPRRSCGREKVGLTLERWLLWGGGEQAAGIKYRRKFGRGDEDSTAYVVVTQAAEVVHGSPEWPEAVSGQFTPCSVHILGLSQIKNKFTTKYILHTPYGVL